MTISNYPNLSAFLSAAVKAPKLRQKLIAAIENDPALSGAYELHTAHEARNAEDLQHKVMAFVDGIKSGDGDKQAQTLDEVDMAVYRQASRQGFGYEWIKEQMTAAD